MRYRLRNGRGRLNGGEMMEILRASCFIILTERGRRVEYPLSLTAQFNDTIFIQGARKHLDACFETLCGLRHPESGCVEISSTNLYNQPAEEAAAFRRDHIGGVSYGGGFMSELPMIEQIVLPMRLAGREEKEIADRLKAMTSELLPLHSLYNRPTQVSQRKQAHAALLRSAIMKPEVILLNGLLDGFDEVDADALWQAFQALRPENSTFLYLSSDPAPEQISWTSTMRI